jgi:hypothetical protein
MAITFPASPADGATFTNPTTGVQYIYNATDGVWKTYVWPTNTDYLQLTGGTLTGDLTTTGLTVSNNVALPNAVITRDNLATTAKGSILQVVQSTYTGTASTNSQSFQNTGLEVAITPSSASSKILLVTSFFFGQIRSPSLTQNNMKVFTIYRDAINIAPGNQFLQHQDQDGSSINWAEQTSDAAITYLDTPSTTSAITYRLKMNTDAIQTTCYFNRRALGGGSNPGCAVMVAMEVAG